MNPTDTGVENATNDHAQGAYEASFRFINELTSKCDDVQANVLAEILSQNLETEYLKRHDLSSGCIERETFKSKVPVISYEDIKHDIGRIYNGDMSPILTTQPISEIWLSSGTSDGQRKPVLATDDDMQRRHTLITTVMPFIRHSINGTEPDNGKAFSLLLTRNEIMTPGGLLARPSLSSVYKNPKFYSDKPYPYNTNTSLIEAIHCSDHFQSIYTQILCGFYQRLEVTRIKVVYGSTLVWAVHFLKKYYSELCHDISSGCLSSKITDQSLRARMVETFMHDPKPELANFIEHMCKEENWEQIFKKIWPNTKYLETVVSGSMAQYIPILNYYSGDLPLVSVQYSSSECDLGFNLNPMCDPYDISYTIMPNMAYYEFLPITPENVDDSGPQPEPVDMANVVVGKEYELVVTTYTGLYRYGFNLNIATVPKSHVYDEFVYRLCFVYSFLLTNSPCDLLMNSRYRVGDVLTPTGFYNSTPQFKILRRRNVVLSIDTDKTTETELQEAIEQVSKILHQFNTIVYEYTSNANIKSVPGHYVIYLELMTNEQSNGPGLEVLEQCCLAMEDVLGSVYRVARLDESIGPLEIRVVNNGTFEKLRDYAISQGACLNQFKFPRCVKLLHMLELLDSCVVSAHFSPSVPRSSPF